MRIIPLVAVALLGAGLASGARADVTTFLSWRCLPALRVAEIRLWTRDIRVDEATYAPARVEKLWREHGVFPLHAAYEEMPSNPDRLFADRAFELDCTDGADSLRVAIVVLVGSISTSAWKRGSGQDPDRPLMSDVRWHRRGNADWELKIDSVTIPFDGDLLTVEGSYLVVDPVTSTGHYRELLLHFPADRAGPLTDDDVAGAVPQAGSP